MKLKLNNKYIRWGLTAFLVLISAITFYYFLNNGSQIINIFNKIGKILSPVFVGTAMAYLLTPLLNKIENNIFKPLLKKWQVKDDCKNKDKVVRVCGIILTMAIVLGIIYVLFYMIISQIVPSVNSIIQNFDSYTANITKWINKLLEDNPDLSNYINKTIDKYSNELEVWVKDILPNTLDLIKTVSMSVISFISVTGNFIIGFIIAIYVMANKENFAGQSKKVIYAFFEKDTANTIIKNMRFTHRTFIGFLGGKIVDSIIIGILCFIGTSLLRLPYAALVSVIIGFTNIIPFFGPFLGAIPSALLIFMVDPMNPKNVLIFVIFVLILQQVDGNIIGPKILGSSTGLTGFWVIFAITLFGGLFGVFGMIIGIPFFAVIYSGIRTVLNNKLQLKELPVESSKYIRVDYIDDEGFHDIVEPVREKKDKNKKKGKKDAFSDTES